MNDNAASDGDKGGGVQVEGSIEVFPSVNEVSGGGLAEKVE